MNIETSRVLRYFASALFVGLVVLAAVVANTYEPRRLQIYFFDVGQGDSMLIRTPDRHTILVDGGPDQGVVEKIGSALPWHDQTIDLMVLTHPHADHVNGLIAVLARYRVQRILFTDMPYDSSAYQTWLSMVRAEQGEVTIADHIGDMDLGGNVSMRVLHPGRSLKRDTASNANNSSIVLRLAYKNFDALLMGDFEQEENLVARGLIAPTTILKTGHHGSRNGSDSSFVEAASPLLAVISSGTHNRYGHPHHETLRNLGLVGATTLRTDVDGDIIVESDGLRWWVKSPLKKH